MNRPICLERRAHEAPRGARMSNERDAWTALVQQQAKPHKYNARKKVVDGITFDSSKEAKRYQELVLLVAAGEVKELQLQPRFPIYVCKYRGGELTKVCDYVADFRYREGPNGLLVIEDVKGVRTPVYRLKRKMFEAQYGIEIREV